MLRISWLSVVFVKVPITKGPPEFTELPVHMAIVPKGQDPIPTDWKPAAWIDIRASVLVGPGTALPLEKGLTYGIWVRVTSAPEVPVLGPFPLHIT
ncbi:hypothetical protein GCM10022224_103930 [Nonomuraea antimicrobica]|uniref:Uncharacterized protein n=1 Tax=Nonomuraea antimicrobica TaxID=561173 RepID=A0ABP7EN78_9ACTN